MEHRISFEIISLPPNFITRFNRLAYEYAPLPDFIPDELKKMVDKSEQSHTPANLTNFDVYLKLEELYSFLSEGKRPLPSDVCEYENPAKVLKMFNELIFKIVGKNDEPDHIKTCPVCHSAYHLSRKIFINTLTHNKGFGIKLYLILSQLDSIIEEVTSEHSKFSFSNN